MAGRKKAKKTASRSASRTQVVKKSIKREERGGGFFDYFRFSESYTSLILGIVVVIIAFVLLISFLRGREFRNTPPPAPEISSTKIEPDATATPISGQPEQMATPTTEPTVTRVVQNPTVTPKTVIVTITPSPVVKPQQTTRGTYIVQPGDDLWKIAEKVYNDGYKWTLIAKENNITNPGMIFSGDVLKTPEASESPSGSKGQATPEQPVQGGTITGATYVIRRGDTLWSIAERRYKNGYRWVDIAKANNLTDPNLIHVDNRLQLPQ